MDNLEKLKTPGIAEYVLNLHEGPIESAQSIMQQFNANQRSFLESRGFPPDLVKAVRLAMADLFDTFATTEEIEAFAMDKVWDLLQTAYDRRQWLDNVRKTPSTNSEDTEPQSNLPFGLHPCDVPQTLKRLKYKPVEIKNNDYWKLMEALMAAAPNAVATSKLEHLFPYPHGRKNAVRHLKNIINPLGLTVENNTLIQVPD